MNSSRRFSYSGAFETESSLEENWTCYYFISFRLLKPCYLIWVLVILKDLFLIEINGLFDFLTTRWTLTHDITRNQFDSLIWAALKWSLRHCHISCGISAEQTKIFLSISVWLRVRVDRERTDYIFCELRTEILIVIVSFILQWFRFKGFMCNYPPGKVNFYYITIAQ
jgi:hypothetical protein